MIDATSATGIPVEYLFMLVGILIAGIYADIRAAVFRLQKGATKRDRLLVLVCDRLKIHLDNGDD
jgi:hypothetical protein